MSSQASERPAILGGLPVRPGGPPLWPRNDDQTWSVLQRLAETGDWGRYHGPYGSDLTHRLSKYHETEHVHLCCSGTSAVELALRGVGVSSNDEVILAGYDFKANFQNVLCLGAIPVLVDLEPSTCQLDPARLATAISPKTRTIIVSHLHGGAVDMTQVRKIADHHGISVIEDACQNPGARIFGRRAGTWGDVGVLSFGGSKLLTAGRGGAVLTQRTDIAERIKRYVLRGNDAYPLSEMQAALIIPQLEQLDELNERRRIAVQSLCGAIDDLSGLRVLQLPSPTIDAAYYKVGFWFRSDVFGGLSRDLFCESLRSEGIAMDSGFRGLHLIHASRRFKTADSLTEATRADSEIIVLHHPVLLEEASSMKVVEAALRKIHFWSDDINKLAGTQTAQ